MHGNDNFSAVWLPPVVNRLLASLHYGERWARHWLDLARYADSDGFEKDTVRPHAWRYRQWVIEAYNRDLPYDQFVIEQIVDRVNTTSSVFMGLTMACAECHDHKYDQIHQREDYTFRRILTRFGLLYGSKAYSCVCR